MTDASSDLRERLSAARKRYRDAIDSRSVRKHDEAEEALDAVILDCAAYCGVDLSASMDLGAVAWE